MCGAQPKIDNVIESFRIGRVMTGKRAKQTASWFVLGAFLVPLSTLCSSAATLDDLKKLEIICFVPSYLPEGFQLRTPRSHTTMSVQTKTRSSVFRFTRSNMEMGGTRHSRSSRHAKASAIETSWRMKRTRRKRKSKRPSVPCI